MNEESNRTDWLSFIMHFIVGSMIALILSYIIITKRRQGIWLEDDLILPYIIGAILLGGGLGSKYGDRLWIGYNYKMIPPKSMANGKVGVILSISLMVLGAILMASSLVRHFITF